MLTGGPCGSISGTVVNDEDFGLPALLGQGAKGNVFKKAVNILPLVSAGMTRDRVVIRSPVLSASGAVLLSIHRRRSAKTSTEKQLGSQVLHERNFVTQLADLGRLRHCACGPDLADAVEFVSGNLTTVGRPRSVAATVDEKETPDLAAQAGIGHHRTDPEDLDDVMPHGPQSVEGSQEQGRPHSLPDEVRPRSDRSQGSGSIDVVGTETGDGGVVPSENQSALVEGSHRFGSPVRPVLGHPGVELRAIGGERDDGRTRVRGQVFEPDVHVVVGLFPYIVVTLQNAAQGRLLHRNPGKQEIGSVRSHRDDQGISQVVFRPP